MLAFYLAGFVFSLVVFNRAIGDISPLWEQFVAAIIWPITLPGYARSTDTYAKVMGDLDHAMKMDNGTGYKAMVFCTVIILAGLVQSVVLAFTV
jgi:hypothetical protein